MRKQLPVICVAAGIVLLAACTNDGGQQQTTVAPHLRYVMVRLWKSAERNRVMNL